MQAPLEQWLQENYPNDVLMPVVGKRPVHFFKNRSWTWRKYNWHKSRNQQTSDVAILLFDICVLDFDVVEIADQFEERFPILREVPMETTRRGRHYFFERSLFADAFGFTDGCSQVVKGVDFKTRYSTDTPGVLVTAPSTNKMWIRHPWEARGRLLPIPQDLLQAVARPRYPVDPTIVTLHFPDGSCTMCARTALNSFGIFKVFDEDFPFHGDIRMASGSAELFDDLLYLATHGELPLERMLNVCITERICEFADYLDAPIHMHHYLCLGWRYRRWMVGVWPEQVVALIEDGKCRAGERGLVEITQEEAMRSRSLSRPLIMSTNMLMACFASASRPHGKALLRGPESARRVIPKVVMDVLQHGAPHLVLAGGSALNVISSEFPRGRDWDVFVYGADTSRAASILTSAIRRVHGRAFRTKNTITVYTPCGELIQFIMRTYPSVKDVLLSFDLHSCRVAVFCDDKGELRIQATPGCINTVRFQTEWADPLQYDTLYVHRLLKYYRKGFDVLVKPLSGRRHTVPGTSTFMGTCKLEVAALDIIARNNGMINTHRRPEARWGAKEESYDDYCMRLLEEERNPAWMVPMPNDFEVPPDEITAFNSGRFREGDMNWDVWYPEMRPGFKL
jgi:hypothetical protein